MRLISPYISELHLRVQLPKGSVCSPSCSHSFIHNSTCSTLYHLSHTKPSCTFLLAAEYRCSRSLSLSSSSASRRRTEMHVRLLSVIVYALSGSIKRRRRRCTRGAASRKHLSYVTRRYYSENNQTYLANRRIRKPTDTFR